MSIAGYIGIAIGVLVFLAWLFTPTQDSNWFWQVKVLPGVRYFVNTPTIPTEPTQSQDLNHRKRADHDRHGH